MTGTLTSPGGFRLVDPHAARYFLLLTDIARMLDDAHARGDDVQSVVGSDRVTITFKAKRFASPEEAAADLSERMRQAEAFCAGGDKAGG